MQRRKTDQSGPSTLDRLDPSENQNIKARRVFAQQREESHSRHSKDLSQKNLPYCRSTRTLLNV